MKRITLIALAAAGLSFAAAPSYAQSSYGGNTGQKYGNSSSAKSKAEAARQKRLEEAKAEQEAAEAKKQKNKKKKRHSSAYPN